MQTPIHVVTIRVGAIHDVNIRGINQALEGAGLSVEHNLHTRFILGKTASIVGTVPPPPKNPRDISVGGSYNHFSVLKDSFLKENIRVWWTDQTVARCRIPLAHRVAVFQLSFNNCW